MTKKTTFMLECTFKLVAFKQFRLLSHKG